MNFLKRVSGSLKLSALVVVGFFVAAPSCGAPYYDPYTGRPVDDGDRGTHGTPAYKMLKARIEERTQVETLRGNEAKKAGELQAAINLLGDAQSAALLNPAALDGTNTYQGDLNSWKASIGDNANWAALKAAKLALLNKRMRVLQGSIDSLESYDNFSNVILREFIPGIGGAASGFWNKAGLMVFVPIATAFRTSLDHELEKVSLGVIKRIFRQFRGIAVALGWASPLPAQKVKAWYAFVDKYAQTMKVLSSQSTAEQAAADSLSMRLVNRPGKQAALHAKQVLTESAEAVEGQPVFGGVQSNAQTAPTEGHALVAKAVEEPEDELTRFIKKTAPMYVRISEAFVKQMRSQISVVLHEMGEHYSEQREVLCEMMEMLTGIDKLVEAEHRHYGNPVLTPVANGNLAASCSLLTSQLDLLESMVNVDSDQQPRAKESTDIYGNKAFGRGR